MSQPGAFASAMKCNCPPEAARRTVLVKQPTVRPKRVIPTQCSYTSIASLRRRVHKQQCMEITQQLRQAFYMGVLSHQRSLVQCGEELVMINHMECAKELFYQLALARFGGGATMAQFGEAGGNGGIHIQTAIAQALQWEDDLVLSEDRGELASLKANRGRSTDDIDGNGNDHGLLQVNETNHNLAHQVTSCLIDQADMLEEYFSIRIERTNPVDDTEDDKKPSPDISNNSENTLDAVLTGLPVLLDGHCPQPHGLPIFLLRLATQVDWSEELPCFHGICKELANYYAMLPNEADDLNAYVQHNLFPALSYLLLPSKQLSRNGSYVVMTKLSTLYKVFERC
eukprot:CAMPEP_0178755392 /NCGR_PEP_ID=MMETSP0744-20121128/12696_1 /TAXON_ID=913974 /ORGANISM="Nitzschia punctata, Strain CCMP561" /LENGTH=340 /DNA_ID=CAMNT_0020409423 /DNA_START=201 /DNA_END=1223 /DNA_ORIENTATION=-